MSATNGANGANGAGNTTAGNNNTAAETSPTAATTPAPTAAANPAADSWPLFEVFVRGKRGLNHVHVGSLHAADERMALTNARDLYTRRNEGVSIWVVRSSHIHASTPSEKDPFFAPAGDKVYRHPTFYDIPDDVPHI